MVFFTRIETWLQKNRCHYPGVTFNSEIVNCQVKLVLNTVIDAETLFIAIQDMYIELLVNEIRSRFKSHSGIEVGGIFIQIMFNEQK